MRFPSRQKAQPGSLELSRLLSLPKDVLARVCQFLHPVDMLSLARSSKVIRAFFMSKVSKPCWDAARSLQGIPNWRGVAAPHAAEFLFSSRCQGVGCDNPAELEAIHLCRQYCRECATENLIDSESVSRQFPDLPSNLVRRLPWTKRNTVDSAADIINNRYYLKHDVLRLQRRVHACQSSGFATLYKDMLSAQRERKATTAEIQLWYNKEIRSRRQKLDERWNEIRSGMRKRWGWQPVPYNELSQCLKPMVDYLINAPSLTEEVWNRIRGDISIIIRDEARDREPGPSPLSLRPAIQENFQPRGKCALPNT